jgi:hypothetical protein
MGFDDLALKRAVWRLLRGMIWNGAGGWVILSWKLNFPRTVSMTLNRRG